MGGLSDQSLSRRKSVAPQNRETVHRPEMLLADVKVHAAIKHLLAELPLTDVGVHAAIKRYLEHAEMHLADVKVHTETKSTPTAKRVRSGDSIVIMTANENLDRVFEALEKYAAETDLGDVSRRDLDAAAQQVLRGQSPLDSDTAARLLTLLSGESEERPKPPAESLTPRQLDVLKLLARGQTNREIAQELVLSPGTVRTHVQRILAKLGVSDRTGAVVRAIELGLITPASGV